MSLKPKKHSDKKKIQEKMQHEGQKDYCRIFKREE